MKIFEVLDNPLPYKWTGESPRNKTAVFELDNGFVYTIDFFQSNHDYQTSRNPWQITFNLQIPDELDHEMSDDMDFTGENITGSGNEIKIFATIKTIVEDFIKKNDPPEMYFSAKSSEPSRIKLYNRFAALFKRGGYNVTLHDDPKAMIYSITKK